MIVKIKDYFIIPNECYDYKKFDNDKLIILSDLKKNIFYTTLIIDVDAPTKNNPIYSDFIHYLKVNNNEIIIDYMPPSPPKMSGEHRYIIYIFEQENKINNLKIDKRNNFNLQIFINNYKLKEFDKFIFKAINI